MIKRLRSGTVFVLMMLATIAVTINLSREAVTKDAQAVSPQPSPEEIREHLNRIEDAMKEVRRDELNYRMEKDMLKEAYASNLQTINTVITIVLGMFTVIGFLGVKSIWELQHAYRDRLDELSKLAAGFQTKFQEIEREQEKAKDKFKELSTVNEEQERRLQVLELQEKVAGLVDRATRALEYISVGLKLAPNDQILLLQQSMCFIRLERFAEALSTTEKIVKLYPEVLSFTLNLAEFYPFNERISDYEAVAATNINFFRQHSEFLPGYFEAMKLFLSGDFPALQQHIEPVVPEPSTERRQRISGWSYRETRTLLQRREDSPARLLLNKFLDFLEGKIDATELRNAAIHTQ